MASVSPPADVATVQETQGQENPGNTDDTRNQSPDLVPETTCSNIKIVRIATPSVLMHVDPKSALEPTPQAVDEPPKDSHVCATCGLGFNDLDQFINHKLTSEDCGRGFSESCRGLVQRLGGGRGWGRPRGSGRGRGRPSLSDGRPRGRPRGRPPGRKPRGRPPLATGQPTEPHKEVAEETASTGEVSSATPVRRPRGRPRLSAGQTTPRDRAENELEKEQKLSRLALKHKPSDIISDDAGYVCQTCGRNFRREAALRRHVTFDHSKKDSDASDSDLDDDESDPYNPDEEPAGDEEEEEEGGELTAEEIREVGQQIEQIESSAGPGVYSISAIGPNTYIIDTTVPSEQVPVDHVDVATIRAKDGEATDDENKAAADSIDSKEAKTPPKVIIYRYGKPRGAPAKQPAMSTPGVKSEDRPFHCRNCSRSFKSVQILRSHMLTHSNVKLYPCPQPGCPFSFKTKGSQTRHMRRHTGERPFKCKLCGRSFRESGCLARHRKSKGLCSEKNDSDFPRYKKNLHIGCLERLDEIETNAKSSPRKISLKKSSSVPPQQPASQKPVFRIVSSNHGNPPDDQAAQPLMFIPVSADSQQPGEQVYIQLASGELTGLQEVTEISEVTHLQDVMSQVTEATTSLQEVTGLQDVTSVQEVAESEAQELHDVIHLAQEGAGQEVLELSDRTVAQQVISLAEGGSSEEVNSGQHMYEEDAVHEVVSLSKTQESVGQRVGDISQEAVGQKVISITETQDSVVQEVMEISQEAVHQEETCEQTGEGQEDQRQELALTVISEEELLSHQGVSYEIISPSPVAGETRDSRVSEDVDNDDGNEGGFEEEDYEPRDASQESFKEVAKPLHGFVVDDSNVDYLACQVDGEAFRSKEALIRHLKTHLLMAKFRCDRCNYISETKQKMDEHMQITHLKQWHEVLPSKLVDPTPEESDGTQSQEGSSTEPSEANIKVALIALEQIKSLRSDDRELKNRFGCPVCDRYFRGTSNLKNHLRTHTGQRLFPCHKCSKSFYTKDALSKHMVSHSMSRHYKCGECGKLFKRISHVREHLKVHSSDRPYPCKICFKAFKSVNACKVHMRTHDEVLNQECPHCHKHFREKSSLERHVRMHTGEKPFACRHCGRQFAEHGTLNRHLKAKVPCTKDLHNVRMSGQVGEAQPSDLGAEILTSQEVELVAGDLGEVKMEADLIDHPGQLSLLPDSELVQHEPIALDVKVESESTVLTEFSSVVANTQEYIMEEGGQADPAYLQAAGAELIGPARDQEVKYIIMDQTDSNNVIFIDEQTGEQVQLSGEHIQLSVEQIQLSEGQIQLSGEQIHLPEGQIQLVSEDQLTAVTQPVAGQNADSRTGAGQVIEVDVPGMEGVVSLGNTQDAMEVVTQETVAS